MVDNSISIAYLCILQASNMDKNTAEEQLRQYAVTLGISMRELRQLVMQVYIDDENFQKRIQESMQHQVNSKQLSLMEINTRIAGMEAIITERKMNKMQSRLKRTEKIKSFFKKPQPHEHSGGDTKN